VPLKVTKTEKVKEKISKNSDKTKRIPLVHISLFVSFISILFFHRRTNVIQTNDNSGFSHL